ncbi:MULTISPECIES: hydroxyacid dehydrogenase [unclassified Chelatococcus]|uniref:hydroxyacid dehydrogenase n=1 Tax=unclassified Chelatococcus TaxID=2638111 RepID=UPI001BCDCF6E|nr:MULTISPECIES: hydroxyacid dehydrogenase [unclassified Chelatococcus]CAH1648439.1 Phosphoglycerate dehydrogenase-like enzyme [Hyphomicrobiales bacterium]MBS7741944.1 hydroxyacid dehydrogenase [Chelatococcus sp. HY11]MBX3541258.1 hydroxyacid dehydrogenase [Chelatococcus sp.]MCO5074849.1 hydroxyacid dehydrogenase [Chelatococcus sp.]CAH1691008.1 Phosphoglycerate dehydrogenase-like enzyme [Hyphomicrobiales bacterium]
MSFAIHTSASNAASNHPLVTILLPPEARSLVLSEAALEKLGGFARVRMTDETSLTEPLMAQLLEGAAVCITGWGTPPLEPYLDACDQLGLVAHCAGSIRRLVPAAAVADGLRVTHAAAAIGDSVAEFTLAQILMALRHGDAFDSGLKSGAGWEMRNRYPGRLLGALTVGIVGGGYVGRSVIRLIRPFGARILVTDPVMSDEAARELGAERVPLDTLIAQSDVVSLHAPLLPETTGMFGAAELARLKDGALLVNMARSPLVDEGALLAELRTGRIRAALDVFNVEPLPMTSPFRDLGGHVHLSPHAAGHTQDGHWRQGDLIVAEVERFTRGEPLRHEITAASYDRMA